jgi:Domain of unknown function (DUF6438)
MKIRLPQILFTTLILSLSCATTQEIPTDLSSLNKEIQMDKSSCFGTCPYYTLTIYQNGIASFEGKRDVEKLGFHVKKLTPKEYEGVLRAFKASNFFELDDDYPSNVVDLPSTAISYYKNGKSKTVTGNDLSRPTIVMSLDSILKQIAESDGWTMKEALQSDD